ncbi:hypothetical protein DFR70_113166 [Nocardia tenerifensis]|uniref:Polyketide cyclase/dehydrase/lipid transport protein n=1 Tax=Nocardia tenerifensis TaxID=228006 RepID=A0A318JUD3_9NOCA|nr:hypothetical protein [Nocardia tenerifensis]PXX58831.1 hypothetical protein DFR70_113166 [Nocardia tenerifensis]
MNPGLAWGATAAERVDPLPCDDLQPVALQADRAISIDAPYGLVYAWLCQLRVAPYSYDLLDRRGRTSPRRRDPRLTELEVGQRFMGQFTLASFALSEHLTLTAGNIAVTYAVRPEADGTRLVVRVRMGGPRLPAHLLALGDLIMMRKQLLTLKDLAEAEDRAEPGDRLTQRS